MSEEWTREGEERQKKRRRRLGLALILTAVLFVVLGQFVFGPYLRGWLYIYYWSGCGFFAIMALFTALVDMAAVRRDAAREEKRLVQKTFGKRKSPEPDEKQERNGEQ